MRSDPSASPGCDERVLWFWSRSPYETEPCHCPFFSHQHTGSRSRFALRVLRNTFDPVRKRTPWLAGGCTVERHPHVEIPNTETEANRTKTRWSKRQGIVYRNMFCREAKKAARRCRPTTPTTPICITKECSTLWPSECEAGRNCGRKEKKTGAAKCTSNFTSLF